MPMWQGPVPVVALVWSWPLCWPMVSWSLADVMAVTVVEVVAVVAFPRWRVLLEKGSMAVSGPRSEPCCPRCCRSGPVMS